MINRPGINEIRTIAACTLIYLLLYWLFPAYSFVCLPIVIGLMISLTSNGKNNALLCGLAVGIVGGAISLSLLTVENFIGLVNTLPEGVSPDIPQSLYTNNYYQLVQNGPLTMIGGPLLFLITVSMVVGSAVVGSMIRTKSLLAIVCLVILSINFVAISVNSTKDLVEFVSVEPPDLSYGYDAVVYLKTVYRMQEKTYYKAHVEAQYNDIRRNQDGTAKADGLDMKISSIHIRHPFVFYFWKYLSIGNQGFIVYISILASLTVMITSYFASREIAGNNAIFAPAIMLPFLYSGTSWMNIYFPDWWAGLFLLFALVSWLVRRYWLTAISLVLAALCREVVLAAFFIFIIAAFVKQKEALKPLVSALGVFLAIYMVHYFSATQVFIDNITRLPTDSLAGQFSFRLIPTSSYLMFFYGFFKIPAYLLGIAAIIIGIKSNKLELIGLNIYAFFHNSVGASSYWGNHFALIILFTLALFYIPNSEPIPKIRPQNSQAKRRKKS